MWRPAHGATNRPGPCRPTNGYGRVLGRPGPPVDDPTFDDPMGDRVAVASLAPSVFGELVGELVGGAGASEQDAEAPAAATP
jgi:hypothetical protein